MLLLFLLGIAVLLRFVGLVHLSVKGKLISLTLQLKNVSGPYPKKSSTSVTPEISLPKLTDQSYAQIRYSALFGKRLTAVDVPPPMKFFRTSFCRHQ